MESTVVLVTNISTATTDTQLTEFFSFCGEILSLKIVNVNEECKKAYIEFGSPAAAKTATLLNNALISDRAIIVKLTAPSGEAMKVDDDVTEVPKEIIVQQPHTISAEHRTKTSVIASLLAKGYILSNDALSKAKDYDDKHSITQTVKDGVNKMVKPVKDFNEQYHISEKVKAAGDSFVGKVNEIDEKLGVTPKTKKVLGKVDNVLGEVSQSVSSGLKTGFDKAKEVIEGNSVLTSGVSTLRNISSAVSNTIENIVGETKEMIKPTETPQSVTQEPIVEVPGDASDESAPLLEEEEKLEPEIQEETQDDV